ncbi:hypothetical protein IFR04_001898 [Cadophora malorum]|uniref:Uncharacterized protein n=1 Tax=Cadophora malorum TaxID=108018 RepID=A0A8H8BV11_9HELO|nr:hypothetical protein IFR04_001898 [Cadophora malorum]
MSTVYNPYEWTSRNHYADKSVHRTGEIRAYQELYGYYPPPNAPLPSIEQDDEFIPGSKSCPIALQDDDELDIKIEDMDDLPLAVVHKYIVVGGLARKAPASTKVTEAPKTKAGISAPPRYHPSLSGKFLASGPPPPRHLRPSAAGKPSKPKSSKPKSTKPKVSAAAKKRTFIESDDEDDFVVHSSYSRNKRARVEDSDDEADDDFVLDHPSTPKSQPKPKKVTKIKKPSTSKKNIRPTTSGKQLLTTSKHPSEHIRPALRELPPRPTVQPHRNKKNSRWIKYEHDCLYFLIVQQRNKEVCGDLNIRPLMDMNLFALMSEQLKSFGIVRTDGGARNYWNRYGRFKVQWDERIDTWAGRDLITCAQESKAGNFA